MHAKLGRALLQQGWLVLLPDGPGQGEARRRGIGARADYEVAVAAMLDAVWDRPGVDHERVALVGTSMGGYFAARAAAFEQRVRALVVWGAFYGIDGDRAPQPGSDAAGRLAQAMAAFAVSDLTGLAERVQGFHLEGVAGHITAPALILHGASDVQVPVAHALRLHEDLGSKDRQLIVYPAGGPGCTHCQLDSPVTAHADMLPWLEDRLR